jgi:hypothetical protein
MGFRMCYRTPDGNVATEERPSLASVCGRLPQLAEDFGDVWVRETTGGAIVLVYSLTENMDRP